jgi:hypothetical protein
MQPARRRVESPSRSSLTYKRGGSEVDDRPPICPACGVTMGMVVTESGAVQFVCLECGFDDDE